MFESRIENRIGIAKGSNPLSQRPQRGDTSNKSKECNNPNPLIADTLKDNDSKEDYPLLGAEVLHITSDIFEALDLENTKIGKDLAKLLEGGNLLIAPIFLREGLKDLKEGLKDKHFWEVLHGIEHISLAGASFIEGLHVAKSLSPGVSAVVSALGPLGAALSATHGVIELILGIKEASATPSDKRKILDGVSSVMLGAGMLASAIGIGGPVVGGIMALGLGLKLANLLRNRKSS